MSTPEDCLDLEKWLFRYGALLAGDLDGEQPHEILHRCDDELRQRIVYLVLPVRIVLDHLRRLATNLCPQGLKNDGATPALGLHRLRAKHMYGAETAQAALGHGSLKAGCRNWTPN